MSFDRETLVSLTADIASAHVSHNAVPVSGIAAMITNIFDTLQRLAAPIVENPPEKPKGALSIRASIKPDHLVSMIDGKPYKMLKRHLSMNGYTPESYRATFDLPKDYPMVAMEYAEVRRALAMRIGLGRKVSAKAAKSAAEITSATLVATQSGATPGHCPTAINNQTVLVNAAEVG